MHVKPCDFTWVALFVSQHLLYSTLAASIPIAVVVTSFFLHQRWVSSSTSCSSVAAWLTNTCDEKDIIRIHFWSTVLLVSCFCCYSFVSYSACWSDLQSPASGSRPPWPHLRPLKDRCCLASSASHAGCHWLHPAWGYHGTHSPQSAVHQPWTEERRAQVSCRFMRMAHSRLLMCILR